MILLPIKLKHQHYLLETIVKPITAIVQGRSGFELETITRH